MALDLIDVGADLRVRHGKLRMHLGESWFSALVLLIVGQVTRQ